MQRFLVYQSVSQGKISRGSLETLALCLGIAERSGGEVAALVTHANPEQFVEILGQHGASRVLLACGECFSSGANAPLIAAIECAVGQYDPQLVVFPSSEGVKDILGAVAVRLDAAVLPDVMALDVCGETVQAKRPVQAARNLAQCQSEKPLCLVSVLPGSCQVSLQPVEPKVTRLDVQQENEPLRYAIEPANEVDSPAIDLSEAEVVVAAGRGVKDDLAKELIVSLANCLGGAVGATRAVVETGQFPATAQIGQTGKVVAPQLYIGVGLSGAIQHTAGIRDSRVIVAINKDPAAPIFESATYGIVGDLYQVLPPLSSDLSQSLQKTRV